MPRAQDHSADTIVDAPSVVEDGHDFPILSKVGGYVIGERIAAGGMGTVHVGLKIGALGFQRLVAMKRLHPHLAQDAEFVSRFKDEIRLVSRLTHPNVVQTLDVAEENGELVLIMEFVDGVTLHELLTDAKDAGASVPAPVVLGAITQALHGLHAAHEAKDDDGQPLELVHRDVSPQNIMIGKDGLVKVLDFGVAKAASQLHVTRVGQITGKAAYMAPEQISAGNVDRRSDIFSSGVVLWEALTGERLFRPAGMPEAKALMNILELRVRAPSELRSGLDHEVDRVVLRALERDPARRFGSARDFALTLESLDAVASASSIADTLSHIASARLARRAESLQRFQQGLASVPSVVAPELSAATVVLAENELKTAEVDGFLIDQARGASMPAKSRSRFVLFAAVALLVGWSAVRLKSEWLSGGAEPSASPERSADVVPARTNAPLTKAAPAAAPPLEADPPHAAPVALEPKPSVPKHERTAAGKSAAPRVAARAPSQPRVAAVDPCTPPTFTDLQGIRHFKPECL